jgi:pimeloyl-ACP methyl ester carboxylesterase
MKRTFLSIVAFFLITSTRTYAQLAPAAEEDALIRSALAATAAAAPAPEQEDLQEILQLCSTTPVPEPTPLLQQNPQDFKRVRIDDAEIAYLRFGNTSSSRPPIVVIAGFGNTVGGLPRSVLLELAKNQEVIVFDNRGQGLSTDFSPPGTPLTIEGMANDTTAFISALNLTDPDVLGISMGGMIASAIATNHGDSFGLIVVAHGSAGGLGNSTPPEPQAVNALTGNKSNTTALLDIIYDLNQPRGVERACGAYFNAIANPVASPENATTTQRQTDAIRQWVSFV